MSTRYKIHPGIGIARVGTSNDGYFLSAESFAGEPFELSNAGESAFKGRKDTSYLMRREGVRFRVFEYQQDDATGALTLVGEVLPGQATINWSVTLGNQKSAAPFMIPDVGPQDERIIVPGPNVRNPGVANRSLLKASGTATPSGVNQPVTPVQGKIMTKTVTLGLTGTDHQGRLVVVGGTGEAGSWVAPLPTIGDYLNNDGWFDTTADGPIDAELLFPDGTRRVVDDGAWVIIGPPDFAPHTAPVVSLHDLMKDTLVTANRYPPQATVSFQHDVLPLLLKAAELRWVNPTPLWTDLATAIAVPAALADPTRPQSDRQDAYDNLMLAEEYLAGFRLTNEQKSHILLPWLSGHFTNDLGSAPPAISKPQELDRVGLMRCIGSGFFPGIEMGYFSTNAAIYSELGRFTRAQFADFNGPATLEAGSVTSRMAVPWQADFVECATAWWPAQRPDIAKYKGDGTPAPANFLWHRGIVQGTTASAASHLNMVNRFSRLGIIDYVNAGGQRVLGETGRDPTL